MGLRVQASEQQHGQKLSKQNGHENVYNFLDSQKNNTGHGILDKGGSEAEDDEDKEDWVWEFSESGGGGRVKRKKSKS